MRLIWHEDAWRDYEYWQTQDRKTLKRVNQLIDDASRSPFMGLGKPEPLRGDMSGAWSRRIDASNRLVYYPTPDGLHILSCRDHYKQ